MFTVSYTIFNMNIRIYIEKKRSFSVCVFSSWIKNDKVCLKAIEIKGHLILPILYLARLLSLFRSLAFMSRSRPITYAKCLGRPSSCPTRSKCPRRCRTRSWYRLPGGMVQWIRNCPYPHLWSTRSIPSQYLTQLIWQCLWYHLLHFFTQRSLLDLRKSDGLERSFVKCKIDKIAKPLQRMN